MDNGGDKKSKGPDDFYHVLGVHKECTTTELRIAYKKLALRWHPDRCSASGNSKFVEEAKNKFQAIQQAYSVLSDDNKRFLYDVGVYDSDDDENGMGDFLNEMAVMMSQTKPSGNGEDSFEQLQDLFVEMFQGDIGSLGSNRVGTSSYSTSSSYYSFCDSSNSNNLQTATSSGSSGSDSRFQKFCPGVAHHQKFKKGEGARRRKQGATDRSSSSGIKEEMASSWL